MKRIIVLGGTGQFGRAAAELLRSRGLAVQIAARRGDCDLQIDANDLHSIRAAVGKGDIVLDAAGPFHKRSTALIEAAIDLDFDMIDINDNLQYAEQVLALESRIVAAGVRVLSSASTVSAVAAAVLRHSGFARPKAVAAFLAPATRHTANAGAAASLLRCAGSRVRVLCDGQLHDFSGWRYPRSFPMPRPVGPVRGSLFESADAIYLPRIWPSLRDVAMYVDANTPGVNCLLGWAARWPVLRRLLEHQLRAATWFARLFGSAAGGIGYEIEGPSHHLARFAMVAPKNSFLTAVAPAVLAAQAIAEERFAHRGLVLPDRHVEPPELFAFLESAGIALRDIS